MASFTCALSSPALINSNGKLTPRTHCSTARGLPPLPSSLNRSLDLFVLKSTIGCRRLAKDAVVRATGETPAEGETELPEILNTIQETWDKLEDRYAVAALVFALAVALWCSTGLISAVDRLPLLPGILELVGIGYTGWFVYRNLIFKPDREALITKVKCAYSDIIGKSY